MCKPHLSFYPYFRVHFTTLYLEVFCLCGSFAVCDTHIVCQQATACATSYFKVLGTRPTFLLSERGRFCLRGVRFVAEMMELSPSILKVPASIPGTCSLFFLVLSSRATFLNRRAAASIIPGRERFSWNLSF